MFSIRNEQAFGDLGAGRFRKRKNNQASTKLWGLGSEEGYGGNRVGWERQLRYKTSEQFYMEEGIKDL